MYEDPPDFEAFDLLTAEQLNILSPDIEALHEGTGFGTGSGWAWTSSVPTITGSTTDPTTGDSTITGWYRRTGRELKYHIRVVVGRGFSAGSGAWRFSLPVALAAHSGVYAVTASGYVTDVSPAEVALISGVEVIDSTHIEVYAGKAGGFGGLGAAFPFALANGDVIDLMLIGETVGQLMGCTSCEQQEARQAAISSSTDGAVLLVLNQTPSSECSSTTTLTVISRERNPVPPGR